MPQDLTKRLSKGEQNRSKRRAATPVDIGSSLGVYDTSSVRDRVRQWQAQGGGVVTTLDPVADHYDEARYTDVAIGEARRGSPLVGGAKSSEESPPASSRNHDRKKAREKDQDEDPSTSRSGSAPAKRVISDAHWRKDRSPPQTPASKTRHSNVKTRSSEKVSRNSKRSPRTEQLSRTKPLELKEDGQSDEKSYRHGLQPDKSPQSTTQNGRDRIRQSSDQDLGAQDTIPHSMQSSASRKMQSAKSRRRASSTRILSDHKKADTKSQTLPTNTTRLPSIEAWLNDTPDPFTDVETSCQQNLPYTSTSAVEADASTVHAQAKDPIEIWEQEEPKESARSGVHASRRKKRILSSAVYEENPFPVGFDLSPQAAISQTDTASASKMVDLVDTAPKFSPQSLKRSGAKRSVITSPPEMRKTNAIRKSMPENDGISTLSSNASTSSVEGPNPYAPQRPPCISKRPFPSTGKHRLSTIASVDTLNSRIQNMPVPSVSEASENTIQPIFVVNDCSRGFPQDQSDPLTLQRKKSHLTKHSDLISILSMPKAGNKSIRSARSIRTNRSRLATATVEDLLRELATDEEKYMRELRTLVDGVIPVLLTCVLSRSDSAVAAGLFRPSLVNDQDRNFTKPIIDMGITLERLKTLHRRIPTQNEKALSTWAQGAEKVYAEYLKAWRMGFQDVVVNLAPATEGDSATNGARKTTGALDEGLPTNADGDVVNGDGERVDVAFLLKRPLVRLKYLARTLKGISYIKPSAEADSLAIRYQNLVISARNRSDEERARLEDEAAANIDPTRARDPRTLAPLAGVAIDQNRHVRARDHFNLALQHSSGQRVDCRVELLFRDDASKPAGAGDLLICEVDGTGRWLLFPPIRHGRVSARNGDTKGEIVVMITGLSGKGVEWQEIMSLHIADEHAGIEWAQMLGLTPIPPNLPRSWSFRSSHDVVKSRNQKTSATLEPPAPLASPRKSRTPSPREIDVPMGEQARDESKTWIDTVHSDGAADSYVTNLLRERAKSDSTQLEDPRGGFLTPPKTSTEERNGIQLVPSQRLEKPKLQRDTVQKPLSFKEVLGLTGTSSASLGLKRSRAKRFSKTTETPTSLQPPESPDLEFEIQTLSKETSVIQKDSSVDAIAHSDQQSTSPRPVISTSSRDTDPGADRRKSDSKSSHRQSLSSIPSMQLPTIKKIRKNNSPIPPHFEPETEMQWPSPTTTENDESASNLPQNSSNCDKVDSQVSPPATPAHQISSPVDSRGMKAPVLASNTNPVTRRRSSSPLKHEYEPSTATETSSESDTSTVERNDATSVSSSSEDEDLADALDLVIPLRALSIKSGVSRHGSLYSLPNGTLKPSESASQAPYKRVLAQPKKASKTIASIFSWSDQGSWETLHPDECSIVITPGLIEAFEMSAAHSKGIPLSSSAPVVDLDAFSEASSHTTSQAEEADQKRPLVALELTPLVPLRRGTAIDISIRSPPIANSLITSGSNIMFRSRNPEECEALYALINHSRINNPTYIALQNARGPFNASYGIDRRASTRIANSRMGSWFGGWGGSSGYRASSAPTPSIAPSESSVGSMSSAFSALKRFGRAGSIFNIARSTISSREGSRANSIYTSSDNSSGSGTSSPLPLGLTGDRNGPIGLSNAKIRLYIRETPSRWRDMGSARLTILRPGPGLTSESPPSGDGLSRPSTARQGMHEKRIVINGKTKGEVLLDVTLGESCFERVARTGIALSVWEDVVGPNGEIGTVGAVGGVGGGRAKVYMIQVGTITVHLATSEVGAIPPY
ncbi:MAG: hypothetical protein Q9190_003034 [Brigantiaea leucoxantha]